jgi:hypothetical protein
MSRAMQKAPDFTADFENVFGWYVVKAGQEVAWRFQMALDNSLARLSIRLILAGPGISDIPSCGDCARFGWSDLSRSF